MKLALGRRDRATIAPNMDLTLKAVHVDIWNKSATGPPLTTVSVSDNASSPMAAECIEGIVRHLAARLGEVAVAEMRIRYELGLAVHSVRADSGRRYSRGTLAQLARMVNVDLSRLRRCARVTEVIRTSEFDDLLNLRVASGWTLTWSHLELLAQVRNGPLRRNLALATVRDTLSVRMLGSRVAALRGPVKARDGHWAAGEVEKGA